MRSEKLNKFIKDNDSILSHFCEVGVYEYNYCRLIEQINQGKKVSLFECFPRCIEDIKKNISGKDNVTLYEVAIFDARGEMTMTDVGASAFLNGMGNTTPAHQNGYAHKNFGSLTVKTDTFDKYDDGTIDALFIDIEGAEWHVINKLRSRPKVIEVETHYAKYQNPYLKEILDWMDKNGYTQLDRTDADTIFVK